MESNNLIDEFKRELLENNRVSNILQNQTLHKSIENKKLRERVKKLENDIKLMNITSADTKNSATVNNFLTSLAINSEIVTLLEKKSLQKDSRIKELERKLKDLETTNLFLIQTAEELRAGDKERVKNLSAERNFLQDQLQQKTESIAELEEMKNNLSLMKKELEDAVVEMGERLSDEKNRSENLSEEKKKMTETVRDLKEQLEQEKQARQKLQLDKANVDSRVKNIEVKLIQLQDSNDKLFKEKRFLEEKVNQLTHHRTEEEERAKHAEKQKEKFESQAQKLEAELAREKRNGYEIESKLLADLKYSKVALDEKAGKLEKLNSLIMKKEEELTQLLTRSNEDVAQRANLEKKIRDLEQTIEDFKEKHEAERTARFKAEIARKDAVARLNKCSKNVEEAKSMRMANQLLEKELGQCAEEIEKLTITIARKEKEIDAKKNRSTDDQQVGMVKTEKEKKITKAPTATVDAENEEYIQIEENPYAGQLSLSKYIRESR